MVFNLILLSLINSPLFKGVENVVPIKGKDGWWRYMTGLFTEYKVAIDYQAQMKARGFEDAFIVTYKNGERISLNIAIKAEKSTPTKEELLKLEFTVQIMVAEVSVSVAELDKMSKLGNIDKEVKGSDMYEYYAGTYLTLEEANIRLEEAKLAGYADAFVFAKLEGERITIEQAIALLNNKNCKIIRKPAIAGFLIIGYYCYVYSSWFLVFLLPS